MEMNLLKELNWTMICESQKLSENFIREFKDFIDWKAVSMYQKLSENFIREFKDFIDWNALSWKSDMSFEFINEFKDRLNWRDITYRKCLKDTYDIEGFLKFVEEFKDYVNWDIIVLHVPTSILISTLVYKYPDHIDWFLVPYQHKLSEDFIREFRNKINWRAVSTYQKHLSEEFRQEFKDRLIKL